MNPCRTAAIEFIDKYGILHLMGKEESQQLNFEQTLAELHDLVEKMEHGGLSLQESLQYFERGVGLIRHCQQELAAAEQKVKILTEQQKLEPYKNNED